MTLSPVLRNLVRSTYHYCCGYCGVSETLLGNELEIDHYQPKASGGTDELNNLVYACTPCNRFKGCYWPDSDGQRNRMLLHPQKDTIALHIIQEADGTLTGRTPRGTFHIEWMHLNRPQLIELRLLQQQQQAMEKAFNETQADRARLQKRIRELESEIVELRQIILRLTQS